MRKSIQIWWKNEVKTHRVVYLLLTLILIAALFVRVYRVTELLQFYYDQGRDALVIWDLWHNGKPFLIGPITGLKGIFLGPFFYYLIAPFYLIGGGNPAYPAVFLAILSVCALCILYYLGWQMQNRVTGIIAAAIGAFSYYIIQAGRWLSNPTPILLTSVLLLLALWKIATTKNERWWLLVTFLLGISMHFESASAIFYIPMVGLFFLWQVWEWWKDGKHKFIISPKTFSLCVLLFGITLLPQIYFNYRHENILFNNFSLLFFQEKGFQGVTEFIWHERLKYFWSVFSTKIYPSPGAFTLFFTVLSLALLLFNKSKLKDIRVIPLFLIFLLVPMTGYVFFQGNYGNIYDYYMTGYYLPMILLFSLGLGNLWNNWIGKILLAVFFFYFLQANLTPLKSYLKNGYSIKLGTELPAVNWVFDSTNVNGIKEYNVDVYVPPVIPHVYNYLFLWQGTKRCGETLCGLVKDRQLEEIYLLYEEDPPNPQRLDAWLNRYKENTIVLEQKKFEGITVERRKRI